METCRQIIHEVTCGMQLVNPVTCFISESSLDSYGITVFSLSDRNMFTWTRTLLNCQSQDLTVRRRTAGHVLQSLGTTPDSDPHLPEPQPLGLMLCGFLLAGKTPGLFQDDIRFGLRIHLALC